MELGEFPRHGAFRVGSLGPKAMAAVGFARVGGQRAVVCALEYALEGLADRAGTQIRRDGRRSRKVSAAYSPI